MKNKNWVVLIFVVVFIFPIGWVVWYLKNPETLPFRHVSIVANTHHVLSSDLQSAVIEHLHGGFFSLNVKELQQALLRLPWVYDVSLRRLWPDRLTVYVVEQQPVARWNKDQLINIHGQLFRPKPETIPEKLPSLEGPADSLSLMLGWFQRFDRSLSPLGMKITAMQLTDRHSLQITLDGQLRIFLGRTDIDTRFEQLVRLYPKLIDKRRDAVEYVDCRYPNGLAIKWKADVNHRMN